MLHGHRAQVRHDAAAFHPEPRRRRRGRLEHVAAGVALEDGPVSGHAEMYVDADVVGVALAEPRK